MEINKFSNCENYNNVNRASIENKSCNSQNSPSFCADNHEENIVYVDPRVMQVLNNIRNYSIVPTENGNVVKSKNLTIQPETVKKFLTDENGKIDDALVKKFISLYNKFVFEKMNETKQEFNDCQNVKNKFVDGEEILDYDESSGEEMQDALLDSLDSENDSEMIKSMLNNSSGMNKYMLAETVQNLIGECAQYIPEKAYAKTEFIFKLSKNESGYDFSDLDKKIKFYNQFSEFSNDFGNLAEQLPPLIQCKDKTIDYELGTDILCALRGISGLPNDITEMVNSIKKLLSYDKDNKDNVIRMLQVLNKSDFGCGKNTIFPLMELCFDGNKKFQPEKAERIVTLVNKASENLDEKIDDNGFDDYETYLKEEFESIMDAMKDSNE